MDTWVAVAVAAIFVWLGMVLAISFLEAPLKFRAPGITIPLGLGIGRLVFRALNVCEVVLAAMVVGRRWCSARRAPVVHRRDAGGRRSRCGVQVIGVRPALTRRSDAVLADAQPGRVRALARALRLRRV